MNILRVSKNRLEVIIVALKTKVSKAIMKRTEVRSKYLKLRTNESTVVDEINETISKNKQNWTEQKNFDIHFGVTFHHLYQCFISGRETGY